ncbi:bifunctional aminodeoxychorismate synthase component I/aminotransferase [Campylobacter coli]|nr:bifunctional aminodeoxychorismate synthase component I/aminotransferase [Campylobacter coli]
MSAETKFAIFGKYFYYDLKFILKAYSKKQSKKYFKFVQKHKDKYYFLTLVDYEFYKYLQDKNFTSKEAYLSFYAYKKRKKFTAMSIDEENFMPIFKNHLDFKNYEKNFLQVKSAIAKGRSYQVNLTQSFHFDSLLDGFSLFNLLSKRQDTEFKAYIKDEGREILSFSPELFFKTHKRKIITQPMKGTSARSKDLNQDKKNKLFLQEDVKNLSENVMIVDLLRNDLSKLIIKNSMKTKLFKIQSYPTLHQMTSIIKGKLKKDIDYFQIFKALFPCGSITGAPKLETIKLIEELEARKRGIYCGAIGCIHKNKSKFSVAIRTLEKKQDYQYSVGSGLVWDSKLEEEFKELELKTQFLMPKDFYLFETMYYKKGKILFFKEHLQRILNSALKLNFNTEKLIKDFQEVLSYKSNLKEFKNFNIQALNEKLFHKNHSFFYPSTIKSHHKQAIFKLILQKDGSYTILENHIKTSDNNILLLSDKSLNSQSDSLYHKSSLRQIYDEKAFLWKENQCFDIAFFNEKNELCEGSRSNIIIKKDKVFCTPTLQSGLLNGIYRQFLLDLGLIKEKRLFKEDLLNADEIYCINSVRGLQKVSIK